MKIRLAVLELLYDPDGRNDGSNDLKKALRKDSRLKNITAFGKTPGNKIRKLLY